MCGLEAAETGRSAIDLSSHVQEARRVRYEGRHGGHFNSFILDRRALI